MYSYLAELLLKTQSKTTQKAVTNRAYEASTFLHAKCFPKEKQNCHISKNNFSTCLGFTRAHAGALLFCREVLVGRTTTNCVRNSWHGIYKYTLYYNIVVHCTCRMVYGEGRAYVGHVQILFAVLCGKIAQCHGKTITHEHDTAQAMHGTSTARHNTS